MSGRLKYPKPGSLIAIYWEDIYENIVGDPDEAETAERITYAVYLGKKRKGNRWQITTTYTLEGWEDKDYGSQSGWTSYPVGAIARIEVIAEVAVKKEEKKDAPVDGKVPRPVEKAEDGDSGRTDGKE
jgi:hypothetical protein